MREKIPTLYIVVPCYNEEEVLPLTVPKFLAKLQHLAQHGLASSDSRLLLVDDGKLAVRIEKLADETTP